MNILYLHGFGSSGNSATVNLLKQYFPNDLILSPDIPCNIKDGIAFVRQYYREHNVDLIIGTSLGGFYAMNLCGVKKVVVNPAMFPYDDLKKISEAHHDCLFDYAHRSNILWADYDHYNNVKSIQDEFYNIVLDNELVSETYALFGDEDDVVRHEEDFKKKFNPNKCFSFKGGHRLNEELVANTLVPLVQKVVNNEI